MEMALTTVSSLAESFTPVSSLLKEEPISDKMAMLGMEESKTIDPLAA